jgi:hypothetical protein
VGSEQVGREGRSQQKHGVAGGEVGGGEGATKSTDRRSWMRARKTTASGHMFPLERARKTTAGGHTLLLERARKTTAGGRIRKRRKKHKLEVLHIGSIQFSEHLFGPSR